MSLLDNGPHAVDIYLEEETTDFRGNPVRQPSKTAVRWSGVWMQTLASTRGAFAARKVDQGQDVSVAFRLIGRASTAPVGWWSRIEWNDPVTRARRKFAVLGGPQPRDFSAATDHLTVTLTEIR